MFLDDYEQALQKIYEKENLICLSDFNNLKFNGKNSLEFSQLISKTRAEKNTNENIDLMIHDLINSISPNIKFALGNACLYFPLANNFSREFTTIEGQNIPTYYQTLGDKRFFFYLNATFEKLYNFWDRIGDLLAMAFDLKIPEREIYFSSVINALNQKSIRSENLDWLNIFMQNDFNGFINRLRIKIVHYRQKDTYFFMEYLKSFSDEYRNDPNFISELQREKELYIPKFKEQLNLANIGFEKTIRLIKEHGPYEIVEQNFARSNH